MEDRARIWATRILAPVAFLAAATALVIFVQRALDTDPASSGATTPATTVAESTEEANTGATDSGRQFYRIKAGDTLEAIASRFDTTVERLLELNPGIDPLALTPRDRIRVA